MCLFHHLQSSITTATPPPTGLDYNYIIITASSIQIVLKIGIKKQNTPLFWNKKNQNQQYTMTGSVAAVAEVLFLSARYITAVAEMILWQKWFCSVHLFHCLHHIFLLDSYLVLYCLGFFVIITNQICIYRRV